MNADPQGAKAHEVPSKSQRKRDADKIRDLARLLIDLQSAKLLRLPLEENIREEITAARRIHSNIARKRQMLFIAKQLRRIDTTPIFAALEVIENEARQVAARLHRVEAWRDHLLETGDQGLSRLLSGRQDIDIPAIRNHLRNAHKEIKLGKPPAAQRAFFRFLRDLDQHKRLPGI